VRSVRDQKIVPIDWVDSEERWIVVPPGPAERRKRRREKAIVYSKEHCFFATGVPKSIIDFIYRSVKKLGLTEQDIIFTRGTIRSKTGLVRNGVSISRLEWGVGTLITIPRSMKYGERVVLSVEGEPVSVRHMELAVLCGLLKLAGAESGSQAPFTAGRILARGWQSIQVDTKTG
jgi:hypothetical protein